MSKLAAPVLLVLATFAGCAAQPAGELTQAPERHVFPLVGSDAVNCGSFRRKSMRTEGGLVPEELKSASDCATEAFRAGRPFYFYIAGAGIDSYVARGVVGSRKGADLYRFSYDSAPCGGPGRSPGCEPNFGLVRCAAPPAQGTMDAETLCRMPLKRVERPKEPAARSPKAAPVCEFAGLELPEDYVVLGAGAYAGRTIGFQIDQSGHEATRMDVLVNHPAKPVVLMLGAYEPTIWNLSWAEGTRIAAVLAGGYHRQVIAGLDENVPTLISSQDNRHPCGYYYPVGDGLARMNPLARRLFEKNVELVYPAVKGVVTVGTAPAQNVKIHTSTATTPESFYDKNAPVAGPAGLVDAERKGLLRKATAADMQAWTEALAQSAPRRDAPPIAGENDKKKTYHAPHNGYVVLKAFMFPAGLYGGHSATFFIPKGVPYPQGNAGHSAVHDFNKLTCTGALCQ